MNANSITYPPIIIRPHLLTILKVVMQLFIIFIHMNPIVKRYGE